MLKRRVIVACAFLAVASVALGVAASAALSRAGRAGAMVTCLEACGDSGGALAVSARGATETPIPDAVQAAPMSTGARLASAAPASPGCPPGGPGMIGPPLAGPSAAPHGGLGGAPQVRPGEPGPWAPGAANAPGTPYSGAFGPGGPDGSGTPCASATPNVPPPPDRIQPGQQAYPAVQPPNAIVSVAVGSISGKVTNASATPIAGASVWVWSNAGALWIGPVGTALDGTYVMPGLTPGSYLAYAAASGYAAQIYSGTYDWNAATAVSVTGGVETTGIDFALVLSGSISGTVTNVLGTPIAGAWVYAYPAAGTWGGSTTTAVDGTYLMDGLAPGSYRAYALASDYQTQYYNGASDWSAATPIGVTSGVETAGIDFALALGGKVSGTVTNALGTPVAGATVYAYGDGWCCGVGGATTAGDGTYLISGLIPGSYNVRATASGYASQYYNGAYDWSARTVISATSGVTTTGIDFALAVGGKISGTVTNALGTPVAGATVQANSDGWCCGGGNATTAGDGTYVIDTLATGSYDVQASASGYPVQYYSGTYDWSARTVVSATLGAETSGIDFALPAGGKISGAVTNASATPIPGAQVSACPVTYGMCGSGTAAGDGSYLVDSLIPGCYVVSVWASGYPQQYYDGTYDWSAATPVCVTSGVTTSSIDFALEEGGKISGTVTNALGTPIAGASVYASSVGWCCGGNGAATAGDGTYLIDSLAPGCYTVYAWADGYPMVYYDGTYDSSAAMPVCVTSGVTTPGIDFALPPGGKISGTVTNFSSAPLSGVDMMACPVTSGMCGSTATAGDGTYLIDSLAPGCYRVSARSAAYSTQYYNGTYDWGAATSVCVASGVTTPNINWALLPPNMNHPLSLWSLPFTDVRNTAGATLQPGELKPCGNVGATLWYQYTVTASPPGYNETSIDTVGSGFNSAVAVYTLDPVSPSPPGGLVLLACNANGSNSSVTFTAAPGTTYFFQVGGQNGVTGNLTLNISPDSDGDGYTDIRETRLGENPNVYCPIMRADVNGSDKVTLADLVLTAQQYNKTVPTAPARYDQNASGKITLGDLILEAQVYNQNVSACP